MNIFELHTQLLSEGGEVFKNADGTPKTQRILKSDIPTTLKWLESPKVSGLPVMNMTLGSVGKKASSGDLDIAVDANAISKDALVQKLSQWVTAQGEDPKSYIRKSGISVHFLTPIKGDGKNGYVQTDFMFDPDPEWLKFGMHAAGDISKYSGADRNLLMSSIAKAQGLKYSWQKGLINRETEQPLPGGKDPDQIAKKLLGAKFDQNVFLSVETMQQAIDQNPKLKQLFSQLIKDLAQTTLPDGTEKKPGEIRKNQEEIDRITRLTGIRQ